MDAKGISVVISGSFRRYFAGILIKIREFESENVIVLSPARSEAADLAAEFVILKSDNATDPKLIESAHLSAISQADALYVYNPSGYIGLSTALEIGWAIALNKPVFTFETPCDLVFQALTKVIPASREVVEYLNRRS